jgi:hypothetical protein
VTVRLRLRSEHVNDLLAVLFMGPFFVTSGDPVGNNHVAMQTFFLARSPKLSWVQTNDEKISCRSRG